MSKPFQTVVAWDVAIDHDKSNTSEFYTDRDLARLQWLPEKRPVLFTLRELDTRAVNRFVLAATSDTEQRERAFRACVVRVDNLEIDGRVVDRWEPKRANRIGRDGRMTDTYDLFDDKELCAFDASTVQEIGEVARTRFFSPPGIAPIWELPLMSLRILGMKLYRRAVPAKSTAEDGERE